MTDAIAARIVAEFGPDAGAEIAALARALTPDPTPPPSRRRVAARWPSKRMTSACWRT
jgi:hypothetical protein